MGFEIASSLALALLFAYASGALFTDLLWPQAHPLTRCRVRWWLGIGVGLGLSSCLALLWLVACGRLSRELIIVDALAVAVLVALRWRLKDGVSAGPVKLAEEQVLSHKRGPGAVSAAQAKLTESRGDKILRGGLCVAAVAGGVTYALFSLNSPHGTFDAWIIWNLRARYIFHGAENWTAGLTHYFWAPDYPLLLPLSVARCWEYIGRDTVLAPAAVALLFTSGTAGLLYSSLSFLRGREQAMLGTLILISTPFFIAHGAHQYADVPLAFFFLATCVLFCLHDVARSNGDWRLLRLAGMMAALAVWTKNEGGLFFAATMLSRAAMTWRTGDWRAVWREAKSFFWGALPILLVVIYFKFRFAPPNDLIIAQNAETTAAKLSDASRYLTVLRAYGVATINFGHEWYRYFSIGPALLLAIHWACFGIEPKAHARASFVFSLLGLMLIGYLLIYVTTYFDLVWHLKSSLSRLLLQLYPSALFAYFMIARGTESSMKARSVNCAMACKDA